MENYCDQKQLLELVARVKQAPKLLIASDFDGTLSDLTKFPADSELHPLSKAALKQLEKLPNTSICVISGRELKTLHSKFSGFDKITLIGSHGSEFDLGTTSALSPHQLKQLEKAQVLMQTWVEKYSQSWIENKPHGLAWHYRPLERDIPVDEVEALSNQLKLSVQGVVVVGHKIIEFAAIETNKGAALIKVRNQVNATQVVFFGDDATDETSFSILGENDLGFKIGPGESAARFRLRSPEEVGRVLAILAEQRAEWMSHSEVELIDEHAFLSDLRTIAIVSKRGNLNWLCFPRIDSSPIFGSLVGGGGCGYFLIQGQGQSSQAYHGDSLICETKWKNITVSDYLDCGQGRAFQRAGRSDLIRSIKGSGQVYLELAPRFNFGRIPTKIVKAAGGLLIQGGPQPIVLKSPKLEWEITQEGDNDTARCNVTLNDEIVELELRLGSAVISENSQDNALRRETTEKFWGQWLASLTLPQEYRFEVTQSALVIRALTQGPSGAIAAAGTTSLPEEIGGIRNWDYRFCWPRDAALSARALARLGSTSTASRLLDWFLNIKDRNENEWFLAPVYAVDGRPVADEAEIAEAVGYKGSRPVRVGNLAGAQLQIDVLGPIAEMMAALAERADTISAEHFSLLEWMVSLVEKHWQQPDSGIWEVRGSQRHYVHGKLMCWYTVDRAIAIAKKLGYSPEEWSELSLVIRNDIEEKGFSEEHNSYVAAYGFEYADAALLWVVLAGFHEPTHPRSLGTINFVKKFLLQDGTVYRYRFDDSLGGHEGSFHICLSWLIEALAYVGESDEAKELFNKQLSRVGPLGLLAEQWDIHSKLALGNYPQAYSHLGVINCACTLGGMK